MIARHILIASALTMALMFSSRAAYPAVTNTWDGDTSTDWADGQNWSQGSPPADGEHVVLGDAGADPLLAADSADLASFTITNKTLVFTNWSTRLFATNVFIRSDAELTLPPAFTTNQMSNRVSIVCSNLTLDVGGTVVADEAGFTRGYGPGVGGCGTSDRSTGGGGYGGVGGHGGYSTSTGGKPYGSASSPVHPGSGGAYGYLTTADAGEGGGAVMIDASGHVAVHGTITANGGLPGSTRRGAGSGGAIYISCNTFGGSTNGLLTAQGGDWAGYGGIYLGSGGGHGCAKVVTHRRKWALSGVWYWRTRAARC